MDAFSTFTDKQLTVKEATPGFVSRYLHYNLDNVGRKLTS